MISYANTQGVYGSTLGFAQRRRPKAPTYQFFFDGSTNDTWTQSAVPTGTTASQDASWWVTKTDTFTTKKYAIGLGSSGSFMCTQAGLSLNLSDGIGTAGSNLGYRGYLRVRMDAGAIAGVSSIRVTLGTDASNTSSYGVYTRNSNIMPGVFEFPLLPNQFSTDVGAPNLSNITRIIITIGRGTEFVGNLWIDHLFFEQIAANDASRLMLRNDDMRSRSLEYSAVADAAGVPINHALISHGGTALSLADIRRVQQMGVGHCLLNHCRTMTGANSGSAGWGWRTASGGGANTPITFKRRDILQAAKWMEENNFGEMSRHVIVPGGWDTADDMQLIDDGTVGSLWWFGAGSPIVPTGSGNPQSLYWPLADRQRLPVTVNMDTDTDAHVTFMQGVVDDLIAEGGLAIFSGHDTQSTARFKTIVDYIGAKQDAGDLKVITMRDLVKGIE